MKHYKVRRTQHGVLVTVNHRPLPHIVCHSPTGLEWGYGGSGPADLALSILADHFDERPTSDDVATGRYKCWALHQDFKWEYINPAPHAGFQITTAEIAAFVAKHQDRLAGL